MRNDVSKQKGFFLDKYTVIYTGGLKNEKVCRIPVRSRHEIGGGYN